MNNLIIIVIILLISLFSNINSYSNSYKKWSMIRMITLSSVVDKQIITDNNDNDKNSYLNFAGVKFSYPLSNHLTRLGIKKALPIQDAAIRYYYYYITLRLFLLFI
jgi:hypothetical protein